MRAYTVTIIRMAITVVAAVVAIRALRAHTARQTHTRPPRARKSTRIPGNRLRCAASAGIEFIIPLGTAPLPDHFRVFAFHGADRRHVPSIESSTSRSIPFLHPPRRIRFVVSSNDIPESGPSPTSLSLRGKCNISERRLKLKSHVELIFGKVTSYLFHFFLYVSSDSRLNDSSSSSLLIPSVAIAFDMFHKYIDISDSNFFLPCFLSYFHLFNVTAQEHAHRCV